MPQLRPVVSHRVLLGAALAGLVGCDLPEGDGTVSPPINTYAVSCECSGDIVGVPGEHDTTRYETERYCANTPSTFTPDAVCGPLGDRLTGWYGTSLINYRCHGISAPWLVRTSTCALTPASGSGFRMLAQGGSASGSDMSLAWANSQADHRGHVAGHDVLLQVKFAKWRSARPVPEGQIYLTGGNCDAGQSCELVLDGLDLTTNNFSINRPWPARDIDFKNVSITNLHRWVGTRHADGSFHFPEARLKLAARVEGKNRVLVVTAPQGVQGWFWTAADGARYFHVDGRLTMNDVKLDLALDFLL